MPSPRFTFGLKFSMTRSQTPARRRTSAPAREPELAQEHLVGVLAGQRGAAQRPVGRAGTPERTGVANSAAELRVFDRAEEATGGELGVGDHIGERVRGVDHQAALHAAFL